MIHDFSDLHSHLFWNNFAYHEHVHDVKSLLDGIKFDGFSNLIFVLLQFLHHAIKYI